MPNLTYPGVYIEEFAPGQPIQGVGTNIAAFLGPAGDGPPNEAKRITSWDAFKRAYGDKPTGPGDFLWYSVRGFFENGGTVCYVVRISTAAKATTGPINDMKGQPTIVVQAKAVGPLTGYSIDVDDDRHQIKDRKVARPEAANATGTGDTITAASAADAGKFVPGDHLTWPSFGSGDPAVVRRVEGAVIRLTAPPTNPPSNETVRLADLVPGESRTFRVDDATNLHPGTAITFEQTGATGSSAVVDYVLPEELPAGGQSYRVYLRAPVAKKYELSKNLEFDSTEFSITVKHGSTSRTHDFLSMDPAHPNYFRTVLDRDDAVFEALPAYPPSTSAPPDNRPKKKSNISVGGGADDNPSSLTPTDFQDGLALLAAIDDVSMVAAPGRTDKAVQLALIAHCRDLWDRFAILDSPAAAPLFGTGSVETHRTGLSSPEGFAALYYPWLEVSAAGQGTVFVPPSGHVAGIYARIDDTRGVHKAPAGEEAAVQLALGVEPSGLMSDIDQGLLNLQGINVIRVFRPGGQPVVWGARTIASDLNWQYVNIRRLFLYLEESIQEGIDWAVFEANNLQLWKKLRRTISAFLTRAWRDGALFGATAEDAFYVRIDEALNPFSEQQLGRLYIEIGIRPSYPAEFIVVRIGIWEGGSEVSEA
jgi:uncharacterized protein